MTHPRLPVTRRRLLGGLGVGLCGAIVAACSSPPAAPTAAPVKPAEAHKPAAEAPKPAAPAPAAAAAPTETPAPAAKPAEAKPAEPAKPAAAPAAAPKPGRSLIGKLEGPMVITDTAQYPKSFKEAPALAQLVKDGKLPPVEQRIGQDPLVIKPLHETGKYGGTWRRGFTGPADTSNGLRAIQHDKLLFFDYTGSKLMPHIAKGWEVSPDGKVTTLHLRRGMKWSDGQPFTADDFVFFYQDVYLNKELRPSPIAVMISGGKPVVVEKVDTYTVRWTSAEPYYLLPTVFAAVLGVGHHSRFGRDALGSFAPAHYLKQFLPKYAGQEKLDAMAKEQKLDNWVNLFKNKNDSARNVDLPVVTAWKLATPITGPTWTFERNPYSIWVDTDGNQLPYIDKCTMTLAENLEVLNLRAIAGEYDEQARHVDIGKLPVLLDNQQRGNYKVYLDPSDQGADVAIFINQNFDGDPEIAKWLRNRDFRAALSMSVDRAQVNETFVLGLGELGSAAPGDRTVYSPGPEFRKLNATLDAAAANALLDKIGLDKKDAEGYRLRTDGKGRLRIEVQTYLGFLQFTRIMEMIKTHWQKVGIDLQVSELERSLFGRRVQANEHQMSVDTQWGADDMWGHIVLFFPFDSGSALGPKYGLWFASGGQQGTEPTGAMRQVMDLWRKGFTVPDKERVDIGKQIWKTALDDVWLISVVTNSPASQGVRVVKNNMGNIPERQWNSAVSDNPSIAHPETFFFK
jgi:peptide/nickel transport system substrate-binding protein